MINKKKLEKWFSAEAIPGQDIPNVADLRHQAKLFAGMILDLSPPSADQSHAIRHVRDAVHSAAQAILLKEE